MTKTQFERMTAFQKGYAVYMFGAREDEPNVPESWTPAEEEKDDYLRGQQHAILIVQDCP